MMETIDDDVRKIKKLLGLNGDESDPEKYYNVTDVLIALMHFCDKNKNEYNWDFEHHLESAREGYLEEGKNESEQDLEKALDFKIKKWGLK